MPIKLNWYEVTNIETDFKVCKKNLKIKRGHLGYFEQLIRRNNLAERCIGGFHMTSSKMITQIMINFPEMLVWHVRPYNISLYQI